MWHAEGMLHRLSEQSRMRAASLCLLLAAAGAVAGCHAADAPAAGRSAELAPLRTLDASSASALRADFDRASDRARYVVALSPT